MHHATPRRGRRLLLALALVVALAALAAPLAAADAPDPAAVEPATGPRVRMDAVHWLSLLAALLLVGTGSALVLTTRRHT